MLWVFLQRRKRLVKCDKVGPRFSIEIIRNKLTGNETKDIGIRFQLSVWALRLDEEFLMFCGDSATKYTISNVITLYV